MYNDRCWLKGTSFDVISPMTSISSNEALNKFAHPLIHSTVLFVLVLVVYLWSAPRTVVLEDDGLFIMAAYFNGIAHPPGYPLYTVLGHWMTYMPFGSVAYRVHMLSAVLGALGCVCLWWLVYKLVEGRVYAWVAALALGYSQVYWSQAIIAEVYSLNVLLFLLLFLLALFYVEEDGDGRGKRILAGMGLVYGLGLSNHWPLLVLSTPLLLCVVWPRWRRLLKQVWVSVPMLLVGLLPYAWMVVRSQMAPEISFYGPIESWRDFWFTVSREGYSGMDSSLSAGWGDKLGFNGFVLRESWAQMGVVGSLLCVVGFIGQWRVWRQTLCVGLVLGYVGNTFLLIGLLGFDYDQLHRNVFRVYPLIGYALMAVWLGLGLSMVVEWLSRRSGGQLSRGLLQGGLGVLVVLVVLLSNIRENYRGSDTWAEEYARLILDSLAPQAVLFSSGDTLVAPIGYLHLVEGLRPDITLHHNQGLLFSTRLFHAVNSTQEEQTQKIDKLIRETGRPVYYFGQFPHEFKFAVEYYGMYLRVNKDLPADKFRYIAKPGVMNFYHSLFKREQPVDPWGLMVHRYFVQDYCQFSAGLLEFAVRPEEIAFLNSRLENDCAGYHGSLELLRLGLTKEDPDWTRMESHIARADAVRDEAFTKDEYSRLDNYRAQMFIRRGQLEQAKSSLEDSMLAWPHPDNEAYVLYKQLVEVTSSQEAG